MNLIIIYSKTLKGHRQHKSLFGGLSSLLFKVLKLVDGKSSAEIILNQLDGISRTELDSALTELLKAGYIKEITTHDSDDWMEDDSYSPMIVEEVGFVEESEEQTEKITPLDVEYEVTSAEDLRLAEAEENKRREEVVRIAHETKEMLKKIEAEARANAEEKARLEAERKENLEARALFKEELNARLEAEKARIQAEAEESARRGVERRGVERLARDAEEKLKKAEAEARANAEEKARLEAERKENLEARARLKEKIQAQEEAERNLIQAKVEAEKNAFREAERLVREAEARIITEEQARLNAEHKAKAEEQARLKSELKAQALAEEIRVRESRLEAMQIAHETEEAQAKSQAEAFKIQDDAEKNRIKAESEANDRALKEMERLAREAEATATALEQARLEAERLTREAEDKLKKAEAEARANAEEKARLEAERKENLETGARLKEKIQAQEEAEEAQAKSQTEAFKLQDDAEKNRIKAESEANDRALKEMERLAREAEATALALEQARLEAERKAEAGEKARLESEHKAHELSKLMRSREKEHRKMVHIAKEAEEARKKSAEEARRAQEETEKIRTKMEIESKRVAREKANAQNKTKQVKTTFEDAPRKKITAMTAQDETAALLAQKVTQQEAENQPHEQRAKVNVLHNISAISAKIAHLAFGQWLPKVAKLALIYKFAKRALIYLPIFILLMIAVLHLVNLSMLISPIEKLASESLGEPVTVHEVHASLWPQPHLVLGKVGVGVGADAGIKITAVHIFPITSTLFEKVKVVKSIEITGMQITQENFGQPLQWIQSASRAEHLKIGQVNFKNVELNISDLRLSPFNGKVALGESRKFIGIDMHSTDNLLQVQIKPQGGSFNIALTATHWPLPVNPKIVFEELNAKAMFNQNSMDFSHIEGRIYNGKITAKATVNWSAQWVSTGEFKLSKVNSAQLLKALGRKNSIEGKLDFAGNFACKADEAVKLTDDAHVAGDFEISNGKIQNLDLARAVLSPGAAYAAGYSTRFDKLTGSMQTQAGLFHYRKLLLQSNQLQAQATLDIQPNQDVSGSVNTNLAAQSRHLQAKFELSGNIDNVKFK